MATAAEVHRADLATEVRTCRPEDAAEVQRLCGRALPVVIDLQQALPDDAAQPTSHFWVAECEGRITGLVGVTEVRPGVAELRRLWLSPAHPQLDTADRLLAAAIEFCRQRGYLKLIIELHPGEAPAALGADHHAYRLSRLRSAADETRRAEFYLDLYQSQRER